MTDQTIPDGFWQAADGTLVPESKVKDIEKLRHSVVMELCEQAEVKARELAQLKAKIMADVTAYVQTAAEQYGVHIGGKKGNITLTSFDGRYKVVRQVQESIVFGVELQAAKALIDECVHEWSAGANDNIKALVQHAFQTDKEGKINTGRVLGLRRLDIADAKWLSAMKAISDSVQVSGTKPYVRIYKRNQHDAYVPVPLDIAAV